MIKPIRKILQLLRKQHGTTMLESFRSRYTPFQILISTVLSARTKDTTTIPIARNLFKKYKTPEDFIKMPAKTLEKLIYRIGFYKTKAKHIKELSKILKEKYKNKVPQDMENLLTLPGVGRKTANCVLVYAFRKPAIPVDIHVHRLSNRIGLVKTKTPEKTEQALLKTIPKRNWIEINELLVNHGQTICFPRNPNCEACPIKKYCNYYKDTFKPKHLAQ
jgi:endonuclease III